MWLIRSWYRNVWDGYERYWSTQRYAEPQYPYDEFMWVKMLRGAMNLSHQIYFTQCQHLVTVGWPVSEPDEEGSPASAYYVDALAGSGMRNNYSGTPVLPPEYYLYVHRDCSYGQGGRELHKYVLTEDDVYRHSDGWISLKGWANEPIGLANIRHRIQQALDEWQLQEFVPYRPKSLNGGALWAPVTAYKLAGVSKMKTLNDNISRKGTAGNNGRMKAYDLVHGLCDHAATLQQTWPYGGNNLPYWLKLGVAIQAGAVLDRAIQLCKFFHEPPQNNVFNSSWPASPEDKYFNLAAETVLNMLPLLHQMSELSGQLFNRQNPEAHGVDYLPMVYATNPYMWAVDKILKVRYTGHTYPIQTQGITCQ